MEQQIDCLMAAEICEAIAASRNDPRPAIDADTVFAELDAIIDDARHRAFPTPTKKPQTLRA